MNSTFGCSADNATEELRTIKLAQRRNVSETTNFLVVFILLFLAVSFDKSEGIRAKRACEEIVLCHLVSDRAVLQRISYGDRIADVVGPDKHSTANDLYIRRVEFTVSFADCEPAKRLAIAQHNPAVHFD